MRIQVRLVPAETHWTPVEFGPVFLEEGAGSTLPLVNDLVYTSQNAKVRVVERSFRFLEGVTVVDLIYTPV